MAQKYFEVVNIFHLFKKVPWKVGDLIPHIPLFSPAGQPDDGLAALDDRPLPEDVRRPLLGERHPGGHPLVSLKS